MTGTQSRPATAGSATKISSAHFAQRDIKFDLDGIDIGNWHNAGPAITQYFNAMSILFPVGELFFIESVRFFRNQITDPDMLADIRAFIGQESMHGREHRAYNAAMTRAGYAVDAMEQELAVRFQEARKIHSPLMLLAITAAAEHLTAIISDLNLRHAENIAGDPRMVALWAWHSIEESEHKAVAFDVFKTMAKPGLKSYLMRCRALFIALRIVYGQALSNYRKLFQQDGLSRSDLWAFIKFRWVKPGIHRKMVRMLFAYLKPGFHPWQYDNRGAIEHWKSSLPEHAKPALAA